MLAALRLPLYRAMWPRPATTRSRLILALLLLAAGCNRAATQKEPPQIAGLSPSFRIVDPATSEHAGPKAPAHCTCKFHHYEPHPREREWTTNIAEWQTDPCEHFTDDDVSGWLDGVAAVNQNPLLTAVTSQSAVGETPSEWRLLSHFTYERTCHYPHVESLSGSFSANTSFVHIPVEPLIITTRDPRYRLYRCPRLKQRKFPMVDGKQTQIPIEYNVFLTIHSAACLMGYEDEAGAKRAQRRRAARAIYFDVGAHLGGTAYSSLATSVVVQHYRDRGIHFDDIYAWNPDPIGGNFSAIETSDKLEFVGAMHFYPLPTSVDEGHYANPLAVLTRVARPEDLVIFKLDGPPPELETKMVETILSDPHLLSLIDEWHFEDHWGNKLARWQSGVPIFGYRHVVRHDLAAWYRIIAVARAKGIRLHMWP